MMLRRGSAIKVKTELRSTSEASAWRAVAGTSISGQSVVGLNSAGAISFLTVTGASLPRAIHIQPSR